MKNERDNKKIGESYNFFQERESKINIMNMLVFDKFSNGGNSNMTKILPLDPGFHVLIS